MSRKSREDFSRAEHIFNSIYTGWLLHGDYQLTFKEYDDEDDKYINGHSNMYDNSIRNSHHRLEVLKIDLMFFVLSYTEFGPSDTGFGGQLAVEGLDPVTLDRKISGFENATLAEFLTYFYFAGLDFPDGTSPKETALWSSDFPTIEEFISEFRVNNDFDAEGFNNFLQSVANSKKERIDFVVKYSDSVLATAYKLSGFDLDKLEQFKNTFVNTVDQPDGNNLSLDLLRSFKKYCDKGETIPFQMYANIDPE